MTEGFLKVPNYQKLELEYRSINSIAVTNKFYTSSRAVTNKPKPVLYRSV
jgi:hypothetical protein